MARDGASSGPSIRQSGRHKNLSAWFSCALVIDFPTHVAIVTGSHLKDWGVTFDEAIALGLALRSFCLE